MVVYRRPLTSPNRCRPRRRGRHRLIWACILSPLTATGCETEKDAWRILPAVARYALGAAEPRGLGTASVAGSPKRRQGAISRSATTGARPLLDALMAHAAAPVAHLLRPGSARPPGAVHCFVAAADASGRSVPDGCERIGPPHLPWDANPERDAIDALGLRGFEVVVHRANVGIRLQMAVLPKIGGTSNCSVTRHPASCRCWWPRAARCRGANRRKRRRLISAAACSPLAAVQSGRFTVRLSENAKHRLQTAGERPLHLEQSLGFQTEQR
jgi:hypothetical protein